MSQKAELLLFTDISKRLEQALKLFEKTSIDLDQDVCILKEWIKTQPHLPETPCDEFLRNIVILNKFSIEKSKQHLDMYYSVRSALPEIFVNKNFRLPHMKTARTVTSYVPMPKLTKEGYRVSIIKLHPCDANLFDPFDAFASVENFMEIRMIADVQVGEIIVLDTSDVTFGMVSKMTPVHIKKAFMSLEKVYKNLVKQIHYINVSSVVEGMISLIKQLVSKKLSERIYAHRSTEGLSKYVPTDVLPIEFGGPEYRLSELAEIYESLLEKYEDRLNELESLKTNESKRPVPLENDDILGVYGNFKQLNVD